MRDLAVRAAADAELDPAFFSTAGRRLSEEGIRMLPGMSREGWSVPIAMQYFWSLSRPSISTGLVHTAHVPTALNSRLLAGVRARKRRKGTRFVQTVTALPSRDRIRRELFWADAITCVNPQLAEAISSFHGNVRSIPPIPLPERLSSRPRIPADHAGRFQGMKVITCPIDLSRLIRDFSLAGFCDALLSEDGDAHLVLACRFGQETAVATRLGTLGKQPHHDRITVVGTVDWILDLFSRSRVVVYPMDDMVKKFNPPLALLEAAQLGAGIVSTTSTALDGLLEPPGLITLAGGDARKWVDAVGRMLEVSGSAPGLSVSFEDVYQGYKTVYAELAADR